MPDLAPNSTMAPAQMLRCDFAGTIVTAECRSA